MAKNKGKNMCSPKLWSALLILSCVAPGTLAFAQSAGPGGQAASEDEVGQLRREVEELKAQLRQLLQNNGQAASTAPAASPATPATAAAAPPAASQSEVDALQKQVDALQTKASEAPPVTAGWNGEHFFLKSSDGQFTPMPVGY